MLTSSTRNASSITAILGRVNNGEAEAYHDLMPLIYQELHRIAVGYLRRESPDHTLQPTALVHEAYMRLADYNEASYESRRHFFVVAARAMRRVLVDHARARHAAKRGRGLTVVLDPRTDAAAERDSIVIALDDALDALAREDEGKARLVEMRFFGGLSAEEIADTTKIPVHVVRRELRTAQSWLRREMEA